MTTDSFTFAATGDAIIAHSALRFEDESERFDALLDVFRGADAAVTQVEPVLVDEGCRHASIRQVTDQYQYLAPFPGAIMGTEPSVLDELTEMGLNLFTAASNHALDFGRDGLETTLSAMRERELTFAGIGRDLADAREPAYLETEAGRVGLIDASTSVPPGGEAGVSTAEFDGECGINPLHVEWTYRVTPEQLDRLRAIAEETGIERVKCEWLRRENSDWASDDAFYFMQMRFAPATEQRPPGIYQSVHRRDREALLDQVGNADASADWVVMALHSHQAESGNRNTSETPTFLQRFARECVDAGADAVVVTGPHTLRGIELYGGRPICYSLGNLFFQEETIYRIPDIVGENAASTVPDVRGDDASEEADTDVDHDADNWMSVVPACEFDKDGALDRVTLYPCTLQPGAEPPRRGTPVLATGERANSILRTVARRSEPFGTSVRIDGDVGVIEPS
ncbi:CapA family protein [Halorussus pelagicus]|uniref:CapA family protein n=1 Tax=Halorussus pelagicus TaxID=2505977 RepID=UPI00140E14BB|nr:CapA family protein [Halorussus pelagicus]